MKRLFALLFSALTLLFACTPENNNNGGGSQNNPEELTVTGDALDVTDCSATLTGYANLPFELGDAEVGIMYDKVKSFEAAKKVVATGLDGNNKFTVTATGLEPSTTYYFKSYVQNGMAVKYGAVKSFTTSFFPVESVSVDKTEYTFHTIGSTLTLNATVLPSNATDKSVEWSSDNEDVATVSSNGTIRAVGYGTAIITAKAGDKTSTCSVKVESKVKAVDLGLPSGLKWAECNLGAEKPEDYGDYYAWGEVEPYYSSQDPLTWKDGKTAGYDWASYKWCNGSYDTLTKYNTKHPYCVVCNNTVLDPEDDAAHVVLGDKWRMPTDDEWTELRENCTWIWTSDYNGTGIAGRIVTSNKTGYTDKFIFLPAAGDRHRTDLNYAGSYGYYWSSSLYTRTPSYAWHVGFGSDGVGRVTAVRHNGHSIRPVSE